MKIMYWKSDVFVENKLQLFWIDLTPRMKGYWRFWEIFWIDCFI